MKDPRITFGIINIDKPAGPTSFSVSSFVMKTLGVNKTSHLGTLDPKVTGVLPITLGRACKIAGFFIGHDKEYVGVLHTHKEQDINELQKLIDKNFVGKIKQTPPHKSAVKRAEREREVYEWRLTESDELGKSFLFKTRVEGGTYIRKLCSDLGEMIGGAHMAELRRTKAGLFDEEKMYSLNEFEEALEEYKKGSKEKLYSMLVPAQEAIEKIMPRVNVHKRALNGLFTGKFLLEEDILNKDVFEKVKHDELFSVFIDDKFVEVAKRTKDARGVARPEFVYN